MLRSVFALALLAGVSLSAPPAAAAGGPSADGALSAEVAPENWYCMTNGNTLYCDPVPEGMSCADLRTIYDDWNSANEPADQYTGFRCQGAVTAFGGQVESDEMRVTREGFGHDLPADPPSGSHVGVILMYVQDDELRAVEAGEGSDLGALMALAAIDSGCGPRKLPFTVAAHVTDGPGTLTVNGRRIEIEQVRVTVRPARTEIFGEILINGDPLDFEYDDNADGIPD